MGFLEQALIFLTAGVVLVPVFKRLGLGSVLGYLTAGILIGPEILGLIQDVDTILHFGELGVVFLLFLIGLELRPERLWSLRKPIFGMGGLQVLLSFIPLAGLAWIAGLNIAQSFVVGMALALSSTAFCLQILAEKGHLRTTYGRNAFSILLFQDLAVVPLLALVPILAPGAEGEVTSWTSNIIDFGIAAGVIAAVIVAGHYLVSPLLGIVAKTELPELFTAAGLVVVLGVSALMYAVELSMALGAFLAGVLLAESEYRHELESVIQPFKGLLLGLFFIAVGMSVQMDLVAARPWEIIQLVVLLLVVKGAVLFAVARLFGATKRSALSLATLMSQGGEFSFVLFTLAVSEGVMNRTQASLLLVVVTLSMAATPFMVMLNSRFQNHLKRREASTDPEYDTIEGGEENRVIIAGFGRFGQIVARNLRMAGVPFTALERDFDQVEFVRRFGNKVYYGDPERPELLRAAGIETAEIFILAIGDMDKSMRIAEHVHKRHPHVKIHARARNRQHAYRLMEMGVTKVYREAYGSSLEMAEEIFLGLGYEAREAERAVRIFRSHDEEMMEEQYKIHHDEEAMRRTAAQSAEELRALFERDEEDHVEELELPPIPRKGEGDEEAEPADLPTKA